MAVPLAADDDCWARALAGDPSGMAQLYDRHATAVYNHCFQRLGSRHDAEDITAEVFIVALQSGSGVTPHPKAGLRPWLLAVANNLLRRHVRTQAVAARGERRLRAELRDVADIAELVVDASADLYYLHVVHAILQDLPVADRELIQLCVLQGIAPGAVADVTGSRPGTVRSRLSRALQRARRALERYESNPPSPVDRNPPLMATAGPSADHPVFERGN